MALLMVESFDWCTTIANLQTKHDIGSSCTLSTGRTGANALRCWGSGIESFFSNLPVASDIAIIGFAYKPAGSGTLSTFGIYDGDEVIKCYVDSDGTLRLYSAQIGNWLYSNPNIACSKKLLTGQWQFLELKVRFHATDGYIKVKLNGEIIFDRTSIDMWGTTNPVPSTYGWAGFGVSGTGSGLAEYDDIYVCDGSGSSCNDFLGDCRVVCVKPSTGNGSNTDFTCSTGADHGALVDEADPNGDTDYVSSSTLNHVDTWNFPALGYTGTIVGVALNLDAKKTDAGTRAIAGVTRPVSTNRVNSGQLYLTTDYAVRQAIWELNPEDSAAWEVADVDGAEFGVKITV